jgi:hypothetical protein
MSATTERRTLPPVTCEPWCVDGDGHPDEVFHDDQWCRTDETSVLLTRDYRDHESGETEVDFIAVSLQRFPGRVPEVSLRHTAPDDDAMLTPAEARGLAALLTATADLLDGAC